MKRILTFFSGLGLWLVGGALVLLAIIRFNSTAIITFFQGFGSWMISVIFFLTILVIILVDLWLIRKLGDQDDDSRREKVRTGKPTGHYISTIESNFILRPLLSLQAGYIISGFLYSVANLMGSSLLFPWWAALIVFVLLSLLFALNDKEPITVENAHVAIMTFFGRRFRWYLGEGVHYWYGSSIGFGVSTSPLQNSLPGSIEEKKGQVFIGNRVLDIWGARGAEASNSGGKRQLIHKVVASDKSIVNTTLTITIRTEDPLTWANSENPILDAAERSRAAFRSHVDLFTGFDNVDMKDVATQLMNGKHLLAAFTAKPAGVHPKGSVLRNKSGRPLYEIYDPELLENESEADRDRRVSDTRQVLTSRIEDNADPEMLSAIARDSSGNAMQTLEVKRNLVETMDAIGAYFDHASVGRITLSEEVEKQANIAAGENLQQVAQKKSAETAQAVRKILEEGLDKPQSEMALMASLAQDGKAEIIYVPGGDRLTRAAVAGGKSIGGKK